MADGAVTPDIVAEAKRRLADARRQKSESEADLREGYFVTRPRLSRQILSTSRPSSKPKDAEELATGIGTEVNEDFATEVINAFMPPHVAWAAQDRGENVSDEDWAAVKDGAAQIDAAIFRGIRASNFDAELATMLIPDGGLGTVAMWISDDVASEPIGCLHVPLRELEINIGPKGGVDDRFMVRWVRASKAQSAFPGKTLPKKVLDKAKDDGWVECVWGYWRDWSKPADVVWVYVATADGELIDTRTFTGEGSCPLLVGRFNPDSLFAFGNGPTLDSLPNLRIINALAMATQNRADISIAPPIAYPEDGIMNFDGGIEAGKAYGKRPGARGEIEPLYFTGDPDLGFYTLADLEKAVRRKHFADYPEQRGDTPPTATQWLDEMVKAQRRIGTPGQKFWKEFPAEVFLRFKYLMEKRGVVPALTRDKKAIATRPVNPATKAQENQEVQVATNFLGIAKSYFPMTSNAAIDEFKTLKALQEKIGDRLVVMRDEETVTKFVEQIISGMEGQMAQSGEPGAAA